VRFGPEGLEFAFNATLSLRFTPPHSSTSASSNQTTDAPSEPSAYNPQEVSSSSNTTAETGQEYEFIVHYLNPETEEWEPIGGDVSKEEGLVRAGIAHFSTYAVMRVPARVVIVATKRNSSLSTTDIIAIVSAGSFALLVGICLLFNHKHIFARKKDTFEEMMMPLPSPNDRQPISTFTRLEARAGSDEVEGSAEVDLVTLEDQNVVPIPDSVRIRRDIFRMASVEVEETLLRETFSPQLFEGPASVQVEPLYQAVADLVATTSHLGSPVPLHGSLNSNSTLGSPALRAEMQLYTTQNSTLSSTMPIMSAVALMQDNMADDGSDMVSSLYASRNSQRVATDQLMGAILRERLNNLAPGFAQASQSAANTAGALSQLQLSDIARDIMPAVVDAPAVMSSSLAMEVHTASETDASEPAGQNRGRKIISM